MNRKLLLFAFISIVCAVDSLAQLRVFQPVSETEKGRLAGQVNPFLSHVQLLQIDLPTLRRGLTQAPLDGQTTPPAVLVEIPMPDGSGDIFALFETPLLAPAVAKQFPDIKTYTGRGTKNPHLTISISLTSGGLNAILLNGAGGPAYIEKIRGTDRYRSYYAKDARVPWSMGVQRPQCRAGIMGIDVSASTKALKGARRAATIGIGNNTVGTQFRTFRLAVALTGEFTLKHGGQQAAFNDLVAYINRVNAVYKNELSVGFQLVSGTNTVYTDPNTDPYSGRETDKMLNENQPVLDEKINDANYDLGMVVSATYPTVAGNSSSGGGIAQLRSLGVTGSKAKNAMEEGDWEANGTSYSQVYTDQVFAHEIGHQFGMQHTFNSNLGACKGNMTLEGSVEPGAGTTIMSYGYTCSNTDATKGPVGDDDYGPSGLPNGPLLDFHAGSFALATQYLATIPSVGTTTTTGNTPPSVTVPVVTYTIPKSTPFTLTGTATDADNDALTYSWEGIDIGTTDTPDPSLFTDATKPPFFRSYAPSASGHTRTYPTLTAILDGTNTTRGEKLPSVAFSTTHRLTVRDNSSKGGGVASTDVTVTIDGNTGPFLVSNDWQGNYAGNTTQSVTWSVNGTSTATPNVKISLSTDGGQSFPTVLLASTPNTGSANVVVPNVATATGRLKVEAIGNIFFDLSNHNFAITPAASSAPVISGLVNATSCSGVVSATQSVSVTDSDPASVSLVATSSNTALVPAGNIVLTGSGSSRSVTVTPTSGQNGTVVITLTATNSGGLSSSSSFTLTVPAGPQIGTDPTSVTLTAGQTTRFAAVAMGDNLTYQWQLNAGSGFSNLTADATYSGVTSATLGVANATTALSGYQYRLLVSNGLCSTTSASATLTVNPAQPDLTLTLYTRPSTLYNTTPVSVVADVVELVGTPSNGRVEVRITRDARISLTFPPAASSINGRTVQNSVWHLDDSNPSYYILSTNQSIGAGDKLSFGLTGVMTPGNTSGAVTISSVIVGGSGGEGRTTNNSDADKLDYFQQ